MTEVRPIENRPALRPEKHPRRVVAMLRPDTDSGLVQYVDMLSSAGIETYTGDIEDVAGNASLLRGTQTLIVEADAKHDGETLKRLVKMTGIPIIAVVGSLGLADARSLMRLGLADVLPLPLGLADLRDALQAAEALIASRPLSVRTGSLVVFTKSVGGVGATMVATQTAGKLARLLADDRRTVCVVDFDVQFGGIALQLDLSPSMTIADLLTAGERLDGELLSSVAVRHASGLHVIGAPDEVIPLEAVTAEAALNILRIATERFDVVVVDLPGSWTNWSLDILGKADLVFMVTELSVPSIRQAKRQLQLMEHYDLAGLPLKVVANRFERGWLKSVNTEAAGQVLRRRIDHHIANDFRTVSAAIDQGKLLGEIKSNCRVEKDLDALIDDIRACMARRDLMTGDI